MPLYRQKTRRQPSQAYLTGLDETANKPQNAYEQDTMLDKYRDVSAQMSNPSQTNSTPSSWQAVQGYLNANNISYTDENDAYDAFLATKGTLKPDVAAEGANLFSQYHSDKNAYDAYMRLRADAENAARVQTAQNDYVNTKLSSYLAELQAQNGQTGYQGVTQGQAIALANNQSALQQEIANQKANAQMTALDAYRQQLASNESVYNDRQTTLEATRAQEDELNYSRELDNVDKYLSVIKQASEKDYFTEEMKDKVFEYIDSLDVSDTVKKNLKNYVSVANDYKDEKVEAEHVKEQREKQKDSYKSSRKSGSVTAGSTFVINTPPDAGFKGNDTVISASSKTISVSDPKVQNASVGQIFVYHGEAYVKVKSGKLAKVTDAGASVLAFMASPFGLGTIGTAGKNGSAYKLTQYYKGSYYDLDVQE